MRVFTQRLTTIVLVCGVVCIAGVLCRAESAEPDKPAQPILTVLENPPPAEDAAAETPEDRIRRVLKSRVRVEMTDVPLAAFARELGERLGIPVVLKRWAIAELDLNDDEPLSFSTRGMSAATMLRHVLQVYELGWFVENGVLTITTLPDADDHRITRIYDVSDLVTVYREDGVYDFDFQPLIQLLTNNVRYVTWQKYGGEGCIAHHEADYLQVIVVWNTIEVHDELKSFLAMLRAHLPAERPDPVKRQERAKAIEATEPKRPKSTEDERPIMRALAKKVSFHFDQVPLGEFARRLEDMLGIPVLLDHRSLEEMDIDATMPISGDASDVSARDALRLILEENEMMFWIDDDILVITTLEDAHYRIVRVYNVTDLVAGNNSPVSRPSRETESAGQTAPQNPSATDATPSIIMGGMGAALTDTQPRSAGVASLERTLTSNVRYNSWEEWGGEGLIEPFQVRGTQLLVITQDSETHDSVGRWFEELRKVRREGNGLPMPKTRFVRAQTEKPPEQTEWMGHGSLGGSETRRSRSQRMRIRARSVVVEPNADRDELVVGGNRFALDLYAKLREADREANLFFSPMSVSMAMAMAQAGARGATADEIAQTMHFTLPQERLHPACRSLLAASRGGAGHELAVANRLWMQKNYTFLDSFLQTTREHYGAEGERVDFAAHPDEAMRRINQWTSEATRGRIPEAVTRELMNPDLRLVLTNAIYFKGRWLELFDARATQSAPFFTPTGEKQAPLMSRLDKLSKYAKIDDPDVEILEKEYEDWELSMLVLLPKNEPGSLERLEAALTSENLEKWRQQLRPREVQVFLPRFRFNTGYRLEKPLQAMGMTLAFGDDADFSGIDGVGGLSIFWIVHKATVEVDEVGTVAAASTAGGLGCMAIPEPPPVFRADHPFVFLIVDNRTRSILFLGRLTDPT